MIEFLLNNELIQIESGQADTTVLEFFRDYRHLTGTKEGCASGDCGACTAVVCEWDGDKLHYGNFNGCITFLGSLHGKQLICVEHLKHDNNLPATNLHAVQQEMVNCHGSQCGFCTPGFIMSLFAMSKNSHNIKSGQRPQKIREFLAGNLCRCTGYKSIIQAAENILNNSPIEDQFSKHERITQSTLERIRKSAKSKWGTRNFHIPGSCKQLETIINTKPSARLLAGGTDLALEVTQQLESIDQIIYLGNVSELKEVAKNSDHYEVGAGVTVDEFDQLVARDYPDLSALLKRFGSLQIRHEGTIGGNIANASPIGDLPPALIALGTQLKLQSGAGQRIVDIENFFLSYRKTALAENEFIRAVILPKPIRNRVLKVYKISKRIDDDISAVCMACHIEISNDHVKSVRIACGGMSAVPERARNCEHALLGNPFHEETISNARQAIASDFQPVDDVRASATYRLQVTQNLLSRLHIDLTSPHTLTQVVQQ